MSKDNKYNQHTLITIQCFIALPPIVFSILRSISIVFILNPILSSTSFRSKLSLNHSFYIIHQFRS